MLGFLGGRLEESAAIQLSCPPRIPDFEFLEEVVGEYARAYARHFLQRFDAVIERNTIGLGALLKGWVEAEAGWEESWGLPAAGLRNEVLGCGSGPLVSAVRFALHLSSTGHAGEWSVRLPAPVRLRYGMRLLPPAVSLEVLGPPGGMLVRAADEEGNVFEELSSGASAGRESVGGEIVPSFRIARNSSVIYTPDIFCEICPQDGIGNPIDFHGDRPSIGTERILEVCRQATDIIARYAPRYIPWIDTVLRGIVPLDGGDGGFMRSSTHERRPGVISCSFPHPPLSIAETLVHEASHQYFDIASRLGNITAGTAQKLYYSPIKDANRPIEAILVAFHAFVNVVLFYEDCLEFGIEGDEREYCQRTIERHQGEIQILLEHLQQDKSVTPLGEALWVPLAKRIGAA